MAPHDIIWIAAAATAACIIIVIALWWWLVELPDRRAEAEYGPPRHRRVNTADELDGWTDQQLADLAAADFSLWDLELRAHRAGESGDAALIRAQWIDECLRKISRGEA